MDKKNRAKPTIVLTSEFHPEVIRERLRPRAKVVITRNRKSLEKEIESADALIALLSDPVDSELLERASRLKVVGNYAVGFNNIDLDACTRLGITVVNTPDVLTRATAELTAPLLLSAARRFPEGEALCRSGKFKGWAPDLLLGLELKGRTAVLVGKGRIGTETARIFEGIGLKIEWITKADSEAAIERKLKRAQVLSLHFPLHPQTHHWLNRKRLKLLPREAIVLNTTRGQVIDENALIEALEKRAIFAAGLDVFENEPQIPARLRKLPNVVLAPHIGSATREARTAMAHLVISGVLGVLNGQNPSNRVNFVRK